MTRVKPEAANISSILGCQSTRLVPGEGLKRASSLEGSIDRAKETSTEKKLHPLPPGVGPKTCAPGGNEGRGGVGGLRALDQVPGRIFYLKPVGMVGGEVSLIVRIFGRRRGSPWDRFGGGGGLEAL